MAANTLLERLTCLVEGVTMSLIHKRSIILHRHKTSVSLESCFWDGLREIAGQRYLNLSSLVQQIDEGRTGENLSSAIRVFVHNQLRAHLTNA